MSTADAVQAGTFRNCAKFCRDVLISCEYMTIY